MLCQRRASAQMIHAILNLLYERLGNALLHEKAGASTANLPLVKPDSIHQAFHRAIEISVFENYEGRLAAQLER